MFDIATLGIAIKTGDLKLAQREFDNLQRAADRTASTIDRGSARSSAAFNKLKLDVEASGLAFRRFQAIAVGGFVGGALAKTAIDTADAYTKFSAQVKLATRSADEYKAAMERVKTIAKDAQGDIGAIGVLYGRIARNTEQLGFTQRKVGEITEAVALALKANGATAEEASSAMLQLSQAFGAGVLRGEEFNAINEAAPNLIEAVADSLGREKGEMKSLAEQGVLTSQVLGQALPEALKKFRAQAAQVQTIGGAFQNLRNQVTLLVGEAGETTGAIRAASSAVNALAANLDTVVNVGGAFLAIGVARQMTKIGQSALDAANALIKSASAHKLQTAQAVEKAQADTVATAGTVRQTQAELALIATQKQSIQAELVQANARVVAAAQLVGMTGSTQARAAAQVNLNSVLAIEAGLRQSLAAIQARETVAIGANAAATAANTVASNALAAAKRRVGFASRFAAGAMTALGGPLGIAITALTIGATAWLLWGNNAEKSIKKTKNALDKNFDDILSQLKEVNAEVQAEVAKNEAIVSARSAGLSLEQAQKQAQGLAAMKKAAEEVAFLNSILAKSFSELTKDEAAYVSNLGGMNSILMRRQVLLNQIADIQQGRAKIATQEEALAVGSAREAYDKLFESLNKQSIAYEQNKKVLDDALASGVITNEVYQQQLALLKEQSGLFKKSTDSVDDLVQSLIAQNKELNKRIEYGDDLTEVQELELALLSAFNGKIPANIKAMIERNKALEEELSWREKLDSILDDALEQQKEEQDQAKKDLESIKDKNDAIGQEIKRIGLKKDALVELQRVQALQNATEARAAGNEALAQEYERTYRLLGEKYRKEFAQAQMDANAQMAQQLEDDLVDAFETAFLRGGDFAESFRRAIESEFSKMVLRPIIKAGIESVIGSAAGSGLADGTGSLSLLGGLSSASTFLSGELFSAGLALSEFTALSLEGSLAFANGLSAVGSALPYVGAALLAAKAFGLLDGGTRTGQGSFSTSATERGGLAQRASGAGDFSQDLASTAEQIAKGFVQDFGTLTEALGQKIILDASAVLTSDTAGKAGFYFRTGGGANDISVDRRGDVRFDQAELEANIAADILAATLDGLKDNASAFADNIQELLAQVDPATASFEEMQQALSAINFVDAINDLGGVNNALSTLAGASVETLQSFFDLTGGIEGLQQGFGQFYSTFTNEQQKLEDTTKLVTDSFAAFNLEVPESRDALKQLVDGLNLQEQSDQELLATILKLTPALDAVLPPFEALQEALEGTAQAAAQAAATANALNVQAIQGRRAYQQAQDEAYKAEIKAQQEAQQAAYDSAIAIGDFATAAGLMLTKFQEIRRTTQAFLEEGFRLGLEFENRRIDSLISNPTSAPVRQFAPIGGYVGMEMQAGTRVQRELALQAQIFASTLTNVHDEVRRAQAITTASQRQIKLYFDDLAKYTEQFAQDANSLLSRLDRNIEVTQRLKVMSEVFGEAVDNFRGFMDLGFAGYSNIEQGQEVFIAEAIANATKRASSIIETNQTQIFENLVQSAVAAFDAVGYSDAIVQLSDALAKGKISIEDYNKFVGMADKQFQGIADSAQDASLSLQQLDGELVNIASRAYSDLQRSVESASGDLARAQQAYSDAVIERQRELIQNQISALDEQIGELEGRRGPFESFLDSVEEFRRGLLLESGILKSENRRNLLRSEFNRASTLARSGDTEALGQVQGLASSLVSEIATNSVDPVQFAKEFGALNQTVIEVQEEAQRKKDEIDNQIQALQAQQAALQAQIADNTDRVAQAQYELLIAQAEYDAQSELLAQADALIQENQLEALLGINQSTQGVIEAIQALAAAQSAIALAKANDPILLPGFATGGVVTGPTAAIVGEGMFNEAIVPLPDGRSIPVQMMGRNNDALVSEIRSLRAEVAQLRADNSAENRAIATSAAKTAQVLVKVSENGDSFYTEPR